MAIFIIISLAIAVIHFVYDGIILPSIRQNNRNKLYALRDELRWEMIKGIENSDISAFNLVHDSINAFVNRLPMLTISVQAQFQSDLEKNEKLRNIINERRETIDSCGNDNIKRIVNDINVVLEETYIANSGGWFVYLIPIAITAALFKKITEISSELSIAPAQEVHRIIPTTGKKSVCC